MSSRRPCLRVIGPSIAYVQLTHGHLATIDSDDADIVERHSWFVSSNAKRRKPYASARINNKQISLHRFIVSADPHQWWDHINGDGLDNRRCNLRPVTPEQNNANRRVVEGSVPFKGVSRMRNKFSARIRSKGKLLFLGAYDTPEEASIAYRAKAKELRGEYSWSN